ncbi:linear amide C-N hydrolase [Aquabacter spiritensis]|uniref:Choloylglycine hydrolase n=1 Tax=Aquabacter spiritensis TaxID=933073 RepID=A0A4R3LVZ2_9HYPH|nr:linear amide C-N hydrolase [Aquabacter spiritensis]TCT04744.1 choloylglycine hydrolase [Aquabacter spiritensis]
MARGRFSRFVGGVAAGAFLAAAADPAGACTRALYTGSEGVVITGRSMDWAEDMRSNLWAFPRGMARDGAAGPDAPRWVSKYGSLITSGYDVGSADGLNEMGLVANMLYLDESDYGPADGRPPLSISLWAQYVLDNFATVAEAVEALSKEPFRIVAPVLPNGAPAQLHLAISDATGDSAVFEYIAGKLVIHHGKQFDVMTNSPTFDQQLALNAYWKEIGGLTFLPGTNSAADRFARASFLIEALPKAADPHFIAAVPEQSYANQAVASVLSVMRGVSVPLGITTPNKPNLSSTLWRSVADQKNKVYFFDSSTSPNTFWVPLGDLDLTAGAPVKKLTLEGGRIYSGNAAARFEPAAPFVFLPGKP